MAKKKTSKRLVKPARTLTLKLTLDDLKKITAGASSFGGDTWQQIKWGKVEVSIDPVEARTGVTAKRKARTTAKRTSGG